MKKLNVDQFRNLIFGAEDSLVSTLGVLYGITSVSGFSRQQIFLTGLITIVVEATSMGAGSFLSESSADEVQKNTERSPVKDGIIMFLAYFTFGFIPLTPYLLLDVSMARPVSVLASVVALFILGYIPTKRAKAGFKMATVAGLAALLGYIVAHIFRI